MGYQALYRKFRPATFEEVKGQDIIVQTLRNQILADRIGHAYIFCGTRGTGKTSMAKLFAKAVNCEHPVNGSPCNECASCKEINKNMSMNVVEIDAASNNGVDSIREIRESVQYSPTTGKYKVYIIDEAHMITQAAFNALLKTLEEPPEYVIFIFATTEIQTVPMTILSRCQRYDFKRIPISTIADRLSELMKIEQIDVEDRAIRYIAKAADGSMRDALSLLDQCISFHLGETLTYEHALDILGAVDVDIFSKLYDYIVAGDVPGVLEMIEELSMDGREMTQLVNDFVWYLRNLLVISEAEQLNDAVDVSRDQYEILKQKVTGPGTEHVEERLIRYIRICSELANRVKMSTQKRIDVELAFVKLCKPQMELDILSLQQRVDDLEKQLANLQENGVSLVQVKTSEDAADEQIDFAKQEEEFWKKQKESLPEAQLSDLTAIAQNRWTVLSKMEEQKYTVHASFLKQCQWHPGEDGKVLRLVYTDNEKMSAQFMMKEENQDIFCRFLADYCGKKVDFDVVIVSSKEADMLRYREIEHLITMKVEHK